MAKRPKFPFVKWPAIYVLILIVFVLMCVNLYIFYNFYNYQPPPPSVLDGILKRPPEPNLVDYKDFISIVRSALSVMITALGIGLAVIAIWGYGQIKEGAIRAAEKTARRQTIRTNVRLENDRQSAAAAREAVEKLAGLSRETVQKMAEALFKENEPGT